ncbi:MAG: 7,8-didemethyl-8-hydroxy-5-deazariboflavin synthase subunit CofG [Acidobacteria bacterium]|nr:MAG: 7,8-didemethyl-8-hydroxy-5-deazariboflavin synthase subunit CofG [Acidobacteriota bacterium]
MQEDLAARDIEELCEQAAALRDRGKGKTVSYSLNVFLPLTRLCRNVCSYCDYRISEPPGEDFFLSPDEVLAAARNGEKAGCTEALLVTGDKPEMRYPEARRWLRDHHLDSTAQYACAMARLVLNETRLHPHTNAGVVNRGELAELKLVNASVGLMLETTAERLSQSGKAHFQSPDKVPQARLDFLARAGEMRIPTTTGLLIGIGETRQERQDTILAIRRVHENYGHIQEVIIQNFKPKSSLHGTHAAAQIASVPFSEILWTCAAARLLLGPCLNLQAAPNLVPRAWLTACLGAGINDWGGISPVTPDYVNQDSPWPPLAVLKQETEAAGFHLRRRFPVYPEFIDWLQPLLKERLMRDVDEDGYVRTASAC